MAQFQWMLHKIETQYPDSSFRAKLGNSYQYSAPPSSPDERIFVLKFKVMKYYLNGDGSINKTENLQLNMAALEDFYNRHKLFAVFDYPHPVYGNVPCKFNKPLKIPEGFEGGDGAITAFELELIEAPGRLASFS